MQVILFGTSILSYPKMCTGYLILQSKHQVVSIVMIGINSTVSPVYFTTESHKKASACAFIQNYGRAVESKHQNRYAKRT